MVEISTEIVHKSLATVAASTVPNSYVYDNPNQQGTHLPAWFIVHREPVRIERENQRRAWIIFGIDLYYMIELNTPRVFDEYARVGDALDCALTYLQIYGTDKLVHVFERSWELAMNCLKYSMTLRLRCTPDIIEPPKMQVIEDLQVFLKSLGKLKRIRYVCTQFSDFDMGIETSQYCRVGDSVVLPFVGGIYRDGDNTRWEPLSWDVGPFGGQYGPITDDATIDLVMGVVVGFDVCIGGTVGVGSNLGSDIVWRLTDMSRDAWHYVGPELVLGDVIVIGGDDLSRDAYEYVGPQKNLGPSPVLGGTVSPYNPFPAVSTENSNWLTTSNGNEVTIAANGTISAYNWTSGTGYQQVPYDATKTYAVRKWYDGVPSLMGNAGLEIVEQSGYIALKNNLSSSTKFAQGYYATCSSNEATVVTVYDSSNNAYNAFRYTLDGTEYYYVLDGTQTDWTDDLASIGYSNIKTPEVGDIITFGNYPQATSTPDPIEWKVLDVDTTDRKVFLLSRYVLDGKTYGAYSADTRWSNCSLREWLNSTFKATAFDSSEQDRIILSHIKNPNNSSTATPGGSDTNDYIFCLSIGEANNTSYFSDSEARKGYATQHAIDAGVSVYYGHAGWWLRSPGNYNIRAAYISDSGGVNISGDYVYNKYGVRPVMWISY